MKTIYPFIWYVLLLFQLFFESNARDAYKKNFRSDHNDVVNLKGHQDESPGFDPNLSVFFKFRDLYLGKKMQIYFATRDKSTPTHLLSRNDVVSIPFSSLELPYLLEFFSIPKNSPQAKAMESTLKQCELKPNMFEFSFCVTSLESMLDMTRVIFGMSKIKVLTTKILSSNHTIFQWYTFVEKPLEIHSPKMMVCHAKAYPYLVYYCHGQKDDHFNRLFKITLHGENGERVEAIAACHMDTSMWSHDHVAFRVLGGWPGGFPVCHFLPANNLVWVAST